MTPQQYVQEKAAASGSSFYYAFLFLPPPKRAAITAFYAFCREVDDVVDEASDLGVAATKLAWWRQEVARAFCRHATQHPVMQALMPQVSLYGLKAEQLLAVIEGCEMDLQQTRYLDFAGLARYCHLVPAWWARWPARSSASPRRRPSPTPTSWVWRCNSPTSSATWATTRGAAASTCPWMSCSSLTSRPTRSCCAPHPWGYSDRFTA